MRNFEHTVNVLVKAYMNDTLQNLNCYACAVGNMVADACGFKFQRSTQKLPGGRILVEWVNEPYPLNGWYDAVVHGRRHKQAMAQVASTGYSVLELRRIEEAFEDNVDFSDHPDSIFKGLMAVVDVLSDIHGIDLKEKEEAKSLFVKV